MIGVLVVFVWHIFWGGMAWHGMIRVVPFTFSVEKSTPAGTKYTSSAGDAGDKLQLCPRPHFLAQKLAQKTKFATGHGNFPN